MTEICVSLAEETTASVIERMRELAPVADLFEVRGDLVLDLDLLAILRARTRPILFSCRPASQGGRFAGDEDARKLILLEAVKRGYNYVDLEHEAGFLDVALEKVGNGLVVSHHDLVGVPADLPRLYDNMTKWGADVIKIAVTPRSIADVGRLMAFARETASRGDTPLIAIAMGPLGIITRVVGGRYGAPFTFASEAAGAETAPGQIDVGLLADLYRVRSVGPDTRVYGVLGTDVQRSLSPILHNRAFEARGVDAVYVPLQAEALDPFLEALPALELSGFSVTQPYKVDIVPHLHELEDDAALAGSVNTVVVTEDGRLRGSTTDGHGVIAPLRRHTDLRGKRAVVLGAGGAARAAAYALQRQGALVTVVARDPQAAAALGEGIGGEWAPLTELARCPWDVLVNATPVGSQRLREQTLVPAEMLRPGGVVFDMVYDPLETRLLRDAQAAGCTIIDGLEMLLAQAAAQFENWTGREAPVDAMKAAAIFLAQQQDS